MLLFHPINPSSPNPHIQNKAKTLIVILLKTSSNNGEAKSYNFYY